MHVLKVWLGSSTYDTKQFSRLLDGIICDAKELGVNNGMVVYGKEKLDEITAVGPTVVCEFKDGWYKTYEICPEDFGFNRCKKIFRSCKSYIC